MKAALAKHLHVPAAAGRLRREVEATTAIGTAKQLQLGQQHKHPWRLLLLGDGELEALWDGVVQVSE